MFNFRRNERPDEGMLPDTLRDALNKTIRKQGVHATLFGPGASVSAFCTGVAFLGWIANAGNRSVEEHEAVVDAINARFDVREAA